METSLLPSSPKILIVYLLGLTLPYIGNRPAFPIVESIAPGLVLRKEKSIRSCTRLKNVKKRRGGSEALLNRKGLIGEHFRKCLRI